MRMLVPADTLEKSAQQQYGQMLAEWAALLRFAARRVRGGLRPARA